jgi:hypothetical protein
MISQSLARLKHAYVSSRISPKHTTREGMLAAIGKKARRTHCALTVLIFGIDLLDGPEHCFFELLDLRIGRILTDFLELFVEIK